MKPPAAVDQTCIPAGGTRPERHVISGDQAADPHLPAERLAARRLQVDSGALALALGARLRWEHASFAALAHDHGRGQDGEVIELLPRDFPAEVGALLFAAAPGEVIGPFRLDDAWTLFQVVGVVGPGHTA